jgi:uncharacterized protein (TIGR02271 family)
MPQVTEAYDWQGRTMLDQDGDKIGTVKDVYTDYQTGKPEWATVSSGLFGMKSHFVPLASATPAAEDIRVSVSKDQVQSAPAVDPDGELSEMEEQRLFEHYGVPYTSEGSTTAQGSTIAGETAVGANHSEGYDTSGPTTDDAMTRSEEELRVGTARQERGRARLRKYVVTEHVQQTVPVSHEEIRIEREPITDANVGDALSGPEISEEEHEVVLSEEVPVVEKRAVPKERVRLGKETVTDEAAVSEEVRKERIEPDGESL